MTPVDIATIAFCLAGAFFILGGTVGILRFPDLFCRLHALTKADTLGLGLIVTGLLIRTESLPAGLKLLLIWIFAVIASSSACYMIGNLAHRKLQPARKESPAPSQQ